MIIKEMMIDMNDIMSSHFLRLINFLTVGPKKQRKIGKTYKDRLRETVEDKQIDTKADGWAEDYGLMFVCWTLYLSVSTENWQSGCCGCDYNFECVYL